MPEETEYLPTGQTEHLNEGTSFKDAVKNEKSSIIDDLDELEKKIDEVNENIPDRTSIRPPLTNEQKIDMLNQIFPIHLGDKVRNKHSEDGIVESVSIDPRGVLYLVGYKEHETHWEREDQIKKSPHMGHLTMIPHHFLHLKPIYLLIRSNNG